jgi:hypothetical protein
MCCNMRSTRPAEKARSPAAKNRHSGPKPRLCEGYYSRPPRDPYISRYRASGAAAEDSPRAKSPKERSHVDRPIGCLLGSDQGRGR